MSSPEKIKNALCSCISEFVSQPQNCLRDPGRDFKRHRKLPLEQMIYSILHFGNETLSNELLDIFRFSVDTPTVSAFVQQKNCCRQHLNPFFTPSQNKRDRHSSTRACVSTPLTVRIYRLLQIRMIRIPFTQV